MRFLSLLLNPYIFWIVLSALVYIYRTQLGDGLNRLKSRRAYLRFLKEQTINQYNAKARLELGLNQLRLGNSHFAVTLLKEAVTIEPENAENHYYLGIAYQKSRDLMNAIAEFQECIVLKPDFLYGQSYVKLADIFYLQRSFPKALENYLNALQINAYEAEALYKTGLTYYKMNQRDQAKAYLDRTISEVRALPQFRYKKDRKWLYKAAGFKFFANLL